MLYLKFQMHRLKLQLEHMKCQAYYMEHGCHAQSFRCHRLKPQLEPLKFQGYYMDSNVIFKFQDAQVHGLKLPLECLKI